MSWKKNLMSGMEKDCDQNGDEKIKWLWLWKYQVDGYKKVNM